VTLHGTRKRCFHGASYGLLFRLVTAKELAVVVDFPLTMMVDNDVFEMGHTNANA
jgi:hypothetical protein